MSDSFNAVTRLAVAELVIYILLLPLVVFILYRHGKRGLLGWAFLFIFCILRLTSSGLQISDRSSTSNTGATINSVGVSGLLLAVTGILHEAATYVPNHNVKLGWAFSLVIHLLVSGGIAIAAVGGANISKDVSSPSKLSTDHSLQKAGYIILLLVVIVLALYAARTLVKLRQSHTRSAAVTLTYCVLAATPFVLVRVIYSVVFAFDSSPSLSPVTGTFAVKFVLIFLMQVIAACCLIVGGFLTRDIKLGLPGRSDVEMSGPSHVAKN